VDNAIISGSEVAANVAQTQVTPRIKFLSNKLNRVMDNILGKPKYMEELLEEIQAGARSPQKQLYDAANRIRIPRGTPKGDMIYARMEDQIPQSYIDALNNSYRIRAEDPSNIRQLIRTKDPKTGKVILSDDLTVEDIDLSVRRMQEDAIKLHKDVNPLGFGVSALKSSDGVDLENLAMSLRADARKLSKEYDAALTMAKDTIQTRQAAMLGAELEKIKEIESVGELLQDVSAKPAGVPVLLRQYLRLGGRVLGFNVDASFGHCLDCLTLVDLRKTPVSVLQKYMDPSRIG
jgi:hypothetical protein